MHMYLFNPVSQYASNPNGVTPHSHSVDAVDLVSAARTYAVDCLSSNVDEVKHGDIVEVWASVYCTYHDDDDDDDDTGDYLDCGKVAIQAWLVVEHSISLAGGPFNSQ